MHYDLENQAWTVSDGGKVAVVDNTDFSMSGTSKKITFTSGLNEYADLSFDSVDASAYQELVFYVYSSPQVTREDLFKITIGSNNYTIDERNRHGKFYLVRIDAADLGTFSSLRLTSLVADLVVFFDLPMLRKVTEETMDEDVLSAMADHISLTYGVSTTLSKAAAVGAREIQLASRKYVFDNSTLKLTSGGTTETVQLHGRGGDKQRLAKALTNAFPAASTVDVLCPTRYGKSSRLETDPICGIMITDHMTESDEHPEYMAGGQTKFKNMLGALGVMIYVECTAEKKTLELARKFESAYGDEFEFLLDGERVDAILTDTAWVGREIGGLARKSYFYEIRPQSLTIKTAKPISQITLNLDSEEAS